MNRTVCDIENEMIIACNEERRVMFKNENRFGYVGGRCVIAKQDTTITLHRGQFVVINPVRMRLGLKPGSHDWIGWTERIVTPEMIDNKIAIFTSFEIKTINDNLSNKQKNWFRQVRAAGGIVEVWKDTKEEIRRIIEL